MQDPDLFLKRARLIMELILLMDVPQSFIDACRKDKECNKKFNEVALTVGENDWWGDE